MFRLIRFASQENFADMRRNELTTVAAVLALLAATLGCSQISKIAKVDLHEGDNVAKAAQKFKEAIGGDVRVIRAEIRPDRMELTVRSQKNPKDIDKYTYANGTVSGPEPVQVMTIGDLEMSGDKYSTVAIDEIGWAAFPETVRRAKELSKLEAAEVNTVSMAFEYAGHTQDLGDPRKRRGQRQELVFTWRLFVEGPRGRKDFWADKDGKLNEKAF